MLYKPADKKNINIAQPTGNNNAYLLSIKAYVWGNQLFYGRAGKEKINIAYPTGNSGVFFILVIS